MNSTSTPQSLTAAQREEHAEIVAEILATPLTPAMQAIVDAMTPRKRKAWDDSRVTSAKIKAHHIWLTR